MTLLDQYSLCGIALPGLVLGVGTCYAVMPGSHLRLTRGRNSGPAFLSGAPQPGQSYVWTVTIPSMGGWGTWSLVLSPVTKHFLICEYDETAS